MLGSYDFVVLSVQICSVLHEKLSNVSTIHLKDQAFLFNATSDETKETLLKLTDTKAWQIWR